MQTEERGASVAQVKDLGRQLNFLAALVLPDIMEFPFPAFYIHLWERFTQVFQKTRDFSRFALGLPRGHGKTIFLKLLILYIVIFTKKRFILIVGANADRAEDILTDVCSMLSHNNVVSVFGNWRENITRDTLPFKKFKFAGRDIVIKAIGESGNFRGVSINNRRPDVMIFDDAQTRENALSETQAKEFRDKFNGTMLKTKSPTGCTFLYVGNMYRDLIINESGAKNTYGCMLRNLKQSPEWESIVVGGLLIDPNNPGKRIALWEDLQPLDQLMAEFRNDLDMGTPETFFSEVLNDPKGGILKHFDFSKIKGYPYDTNSEQCDGKFLLIDPSLGKKTSDDLVVNLYYLIDGQPVLREVRIIEDSVPNMVRLVIEWAMQERIPLVLAEDYGFQASLVQWFQTISQQIGLEGVTFAGINRGKLSKNSAILGMLKELTSNQLLMHPDVRTQVFDQIAFFDPSTTKNKDDIIDNMAYARIAVRDHAHTMLVDLTQSELPPVGDCKN